jgi:fluoroquinolone transport system permease protein
MNHFLTLSFSDFRATFRDPIFKGLLAFPFIAFALIRWVLPIIVASFPIVKDYQTVILMWACLQSAIMFGFIYGFLFLEEKEENIWQVLQILPVSTIKLVFSRLFLGLLVSTIVNFCMLRFGDILSLSLFKEILLAFQFSLAAPLIALTIAALAKNRIEGLAQMKVVNLLLILPAFIYFFPYQLLHITAIIPTYWAFKSLEAANTGDGFAITFLTGSIYFLIIILFLNQKLGRQE